MFLQDVHELSVLRKGMSVKIIEPLTLPSEHERMNMRRVHQVLVLGGTGKTGSRVAERLSAHGVSVRTAARSGADVHFDWDNQATFDDVLRGATGLYLVSPTLRTGFAGLVAQFLEQAVRSGVRHVTYLSAYGMEHAPAEVALRAVELDLATRSSLTSSVIRPAWFMEDFSETFLQPVNDEIAVPAGEGAEAFVSVEDIASVAAVTLTEPERHAGSAYAPTGPQALTMAEAAELITAAAGRTITYRDTDREQWIAAIISSGVPAQYAQVLRPLTETLASGNGARPNGDVLAVTGTAPVTFAEFTAKAATAWK
jgi:uncharacterized protein YbjT (DUF2867 family)